MMHQRYVQSSSFRNSSLYLCLSLAALLIFGLAQARSAVLQAQTTTQPKEVAITIDDLPLNGPQFDAGRLRAMTGKILAAIDKHRIPVVGFVNESLLHVAGETDARIAILKAWSDGGVELGNHTFSHLGFKDVTLADYEDNFVRGEAVTRMLLKQKGQKVRYFRHPFLQMGATREIEQSFENFIAERGYKIAPVTVDDMDWMILSAYAGARAQGDAEMMKRVSEEYLKFAGRRFDFSEQVAGDLFGRPIKHILLLHANELVADNLDGLATMLENKGYRFITLEQALKDPVYQAPDKYKDTSDWLSHWAFSKGKKFTPPMPPDFIQKPYLDNQKRSSLPPQQTRLSHLPATKREARCRGGLSLYSLIAVYQLSETPGMQAGSVPKPGTRLCRMTWGWQALSLPMETRHPVSEPGIAGITPGAIARHYSQPAGMFYPATAGCGDLNARPCGLVSGLSGHKRGSSRRLDDAKFLSTQNEAFVGGEEFGGNGENDGRKCLPSPSKAAYANTLARSALRRANVDKETRLYVNRGHHAGAGHRREHGDLYGGQRHAAAPAALRRSRSVGDALG